MPPLDDMPRWRNLETGDEAHMSFADAAEARKAGGDWVWIHPHSVGWQHRPVEPPPLPNVADLKKMAKKVHDAQDGL